jgi:hypothetical protein
VNAEKAADLWRAAGLDVKAFFVQPEDAEELNEKYSFL